MRRLFKKITKNSRSEEDGIFFDKLYKILGFKPTELKYYKKAFTHRSSNKLDEKGNPFNYERLEFLGDAMLLGCHVNLTGGDRRRSHAVPGECRY